jgi:hypothetical protein
MSKKIPKKINKYNPKLPIGEFYVSNKPDFERTGSQAVLLYRLVYSSVFSYVASIFLLLSFTFQGIDFAYADEIISETNVEQSEVMSIENNSAVDEFENENYEESLDLSNDNLDQINSTEDVTGQDLENLETEEQNNDGDEILSEDVSVQEDVNDVDLDQINSTEDVTEQDLDNFETEEQNIDENEILSEADLVASTTETISIVQSDSAFSFTKNECTQLANGSFYCIKPQENVLKDALFAAPDEQGDLEIYFVKDGNQMQVTDNAEEDASPFYDQNTNTIVWHRLIEDRYQIILYDIEAGIEKVITNTNSNNMEPNKQGDFIVWQRWVDGTWNIILFDNGKENQITTGSGNNVAPYIHGSLVVWNRHSADGIKTIEIYNIDSRTYVTVDDPDGLTVSNPRMVFVYDSLAPNGDIVTKGYDLLAKKFIELDSLPKELPDEIPSSDSTGETRALIQSKPTSKSELEEIINSTSTITGAGNGNSSSTATSSSNSNTSVSDTHIIDESLTLDLSTSTVQNLSLENTEIDFSQFDIVVEPYIAEVIEEGVSNFVEPVQE